ncbi:PIG-L family deacetylase [Alicyclobacillus fastidiosus]|uniref:PIG-L family deacetylase n=1 Tax=Alicyclobacillus fastidiosus TaxID=392011 RepID=A0ABV5ADG6_9BACL|nr:PIG-L family deacetylase [Alicyclobacillus fastidiosus]WEH08668.1 PIG-L family deacetylase [Alicyclobacillus fastidiosus]
MSTIVAVFAHPDDESFICGGTLAKLAQEGHRVVLVCATLGEMGRRMGVPPAVTRESIAAQRERELRTACEALSIARLELLHLRDKTLEIQPIEALVERVLDVFEEERPDAVITFHDPLGGHPDHCAIGRVATRAFEAYARTAASEPLCRLFYVAWSDDVNAFQRYSQPVIDMVTVDIQATKVQKLASFRAHRTQSGLNRSIWGSEKQSLGQLSNWEYFVHTQGPRLERRDSLVESR